MERCNQSTSIKYLFKYINKQYDQIATSIVTDKNSNTSPPEDVDEIKQYLDCRYISQCEECWRIYSFSIHGRKLTIERMFFYLSRQKSIHFTDYDRINYVLIKPSVTESMFTSWFETNKKYPEARDLTDGQFVTKFVYVKRTRTWKPRKRGFTIGR